MSEYSLRDIKCLDDIIAEHMDIDGGSPPLLHMPHDGAIGMFQFDGPHGNQCDCFYWSTPDLDYIQVTWAPHVGVIQTCTLVLDPNLSTSPF